MDQLIKPKQLAEIWDLPERTIQRWVTDGTIKKPCIFQPPGKRVRLKLPMLLELHPEWFSPEFIHGKKSKRIKELTNALKDCIHVMEKGIEVRMTDQWPALAGILPSTLERAKEVLKDNNHKASLDLTP